MPSFTFRKESFRDKLRNYMKKDNSYRHEASFLPMSHTTLYRIASGKRDVKMNEFIEICNRMDVDPIQFFDEDWNQRKMF